MLLILTNSNDVTSDYLAGVLRENGVPFVRFDTDVSLEKTVCDYTTGRPELRIDKQWYLPRDFTNVWYRRPERLKHSLLSDTAESKLILDEWSEALDGFLAHIPVQRWMNHPSANVGASHKIEQLTTARRLGLSVPDTLLTQDPTKLRDFFARHAGSIIVKPISVGYIDRDDGHPDSLIYTNPVAQQHLVDLNDLPSCPTLFQERVDKAVDIRITVVDEAIHAIQLTACDPGGSQRCDIRRNNMEDVAYQPIAVPEDVEHGLRRLLDNYNLRFGAIDMAITNTGDWVFFEVNPNGQWAWLDLAGAADIASSFVQSFTPEQREKT